MLHALLIKDTIFLTKMYMQMNVTVLKVLGRQASNVKSEDVQETASV